MPDLKHITHPLLSDARVIHGFFGRAGGMSGGIYASLNCGPGSRDNSAHVSENRARVAHALGMAPERLCTLYQIHSATAVIIEKPWEGSPPQADAMVTNIPGLTLGILTADCAPVMFMDASARVIGAAHAGWKGAFTGVIENTIAAMETLGAERSRIVAVIGPCITQPSYEVGPEFIARFMLEDQKDFFVPSTRADHYRFDLPGYVLRQLSRAGVGQCAALGVDTCSNPEQYFSYRRTTLAGEPDYGRQISAIALKA